MSGTPHARPTNTSALGTVGRHSRVSVPVAAAARRRVRHAQREIRESEHRHTWLALLRSQRRRVPHRLLQRGLFFLEHVPIRCDTASQPLGVIPAKAGIHRLGRCHDLLSSRAPVIMDSGWRRNDNRVGNRQMLSARYLPAIGPRSNGLALCYGRTQDLMQRHRRSGHRKSAVGGAEVPDLVADSCASHS
jgi:hypothetical protein